MCVALVIQHQKSMRHNILPFVTCMDPSYFSTLPKKLHDILKNIIEHKMCILISFIILSATFLILRIIQLDNIVNVNTSSCKVHVILFRFQ